MKKIEKDMFIRTKRNYFCNTVAIRKIDEIDDEDGKFWIDDYVWDTYGDEQNILCEKDVELASFDILDVIKVGDYVNGEKVLCTNCKLEYIDDDSETGVNEVDNGLELETGWIYFEHEVQSIVTKEMFDNITYHL